MHNSLLEIVLAIFALGVPVVLLLRRLGISTLVAYLVTGTLCSNLGWAQHADVATLGEIGAALLLFALGMELDLPAMRERMRQVVIGAVGQVGSTIVVGTLLMLATGIAWQPAVAVGCCLALSSTVMVLRALDEHGLRQREEGKTIIGLLLTQDIMLAPMMVLLALLLPGDGHRPPIWLTGVGMIVLLVLTMVVRRFLAHQLIARVSAANVPELDVAFALTFAIGAAYLTDIVGLGAAVGAFCAGLALGGDEHRHSIETATKPLAGIMAILFFVSVGLQFDVAFVADHIGLTLAVLLVSMLIKALLAGGALYLAGLPPRAALGCGLMVGQIGEFSFVLAASAYGGGAGPLSEELYRLVVAVACLSLALTPLLIRLGRPLLPRSVLAQVLSRGETIVVAGMGPVGNTVVETLRRDGIPLMLVDRNPHLLAPWQDQEGIRCHQGRIETMDDWLPKLGERPRAVILTFPIVDASVLVAERLRSVDQQLAIIARCQYTAQIEQCYQAGIQAVLCDEQATLSALQPVLMSVLGKPDRRPDTAAG